MQFLIANLLLLMLLLLWVVLLLLMCGRPLLLTVGPALLLCGSRRRWLLWLRVVTRRRAQAPGMQLAGVVRRVRLKEVRVILDLCGAIYIAYVSICDEDSCCVSCECVSVCV